MSRSSSGGRGGLRTLALVAAVAIALASTAVVVLSDDTQKLRLAVVGALWAFVLAAFAAPRRREPEAPSSGDPGAAVELRRTYEIELEKEVAARREYELQLEVFLRREMEQGLVEDVAALREEVGRMRGEMIDRLDGELRMERIETTRLIGGSLRALRDEARRLGIGLPVPPELAGDYPADPLTHGPGNGSGEYAGRPGSGAISPGLPPAGGISPGVPPAGGFEGRPTRPPAAAEAGLPGRPAQPGPPPQPGPTAQAGQPSQPAPPGPRPPAGNESVPRRRRRSRDDGEDNEVMSRLLGR